MQSWTLMIMLHLDRKKYLHCEIQHRKTPGRYRTACHFHPLFYFPPVEFSLKLPSYFFLPLNPFSKDWYNYLYRLLLPKQIWTTLVLMERLVAWWMEQDWPWLPWTLSSCMVVHLPISLMLVEVHRRVRYIVNILTCLCYPYYIAKLYYHLIDKKRLGIHLDPFYNLVSFVHYSLLRRIYFQLCISY